MPQMPPARDAALAAVHDRFGAGVRASAGEVIELADIGAVASLVAERTEVVALSPALHARRPELERGLSSRGIEVLVATDEDPAGTVADVPVAIVAGVLGVAETGSVLVSEHELGDRVTTMLCRALVLLVERPTIVDRLETVATWLSTRPAGAGFAALITGPSRTADIERSLSIGVQGPQEVTVVVLG